MTSARAGHTIRAAHVYYHPFKDGKCYDYFSYALSPALTPEERERALPLGVRVDDTLSTQDESRGALKIVGQTETKSPRDETWRQDILDKLCSVFGPTVTADNVLVVFPDYALAEEFWAS